MPLSALDARARINERVTVEMPVKAVKNCQRCSLMFLDSEEDHRDAKDFAVGVTEIGKGKFKAARIDDPAGHFKGKTIRVTGMVIVKDKQPQIEVDNPGQIERVAIGVHPRLVGSDRGADKLKDRGALIPRHRRRLVTAIIAFSTK